MLPRFPFLLFFFLLAGVPALAEEVLLNRLDKQERFGGMQLSLELSSLVPHRIETSGQRIDLFLTGIKANPSGLPRLPENGSVIRILLARLPQELMVSILLRSSPEAVKVSTLERPATVLLEVTWKERERTVPAGTVVPLSGAARVRGNAGSTRRPGASPYAGDWKSFFRRHESSLTIAVPPACTLPELPPLGDARNATAAEGGKGGEVSLLLLGEALARQGEYAEATSLFSRFLAEHPHSEWRERGRYLLAAARAGGGNPYQARVELARLEGDRPYAPYRQLLEAELDLATGRPAAALARLQALSQAAPLGWRSLLALRQGDALSAMGETGSALAAYRQANLPEALWSRHPSSLAGLAESLYRSGNPAAAARRYHELAAVLPSGEVADLARFAEGRCRLAAGDQGGEALLAGLARKSPESEGGVRARLKLADLAVSGGATGLDPMTVFREVARQAPGRALREEAALKEAILLFLNGELGASIGQLQEYRRYFGAGPLRWEAEALLSEVLPGRIEELIAGGEELKALVLVEQHPKLLLSAATPPDLLLRLGETFERVGLLDKAARVFAFTADNCRGRPEERGAALALARVLVAAEDFPAAAEAARSFLERFRTDPRRTEVFALLLEALYASGRLEEAAKILTSPGRPSDPRIEALAGRVFWRAGEMDRAQRALAVAEQPEGEAGLTLLMRAEALFRQGKLAPAQQIYQRLLAIGQFAEQAQFRSAQIHLAQGEPQQGLKLLARLAEKGEQSPWQRAGAEFLQLHQNNPFPRR